MLVLRHNLSDVRKMPGAIAGRIGRIFHPCQIEGNRRGIELLSITEGDVVTQNEGVFQAIVRNRVALGQPRHITAFRCARQKRFIGVTQD
ncbi:hypothetical protein D3C73_675850 [compost metagenome]